MKILVSYRASQNIRGWESGAILARAFRRLGHEVTDYAYIYENPHLWNCPSGRFGFSIADPIFSMEDFGTFDLCVSCECNDHLPQYTELKGVADKHVFWVFDVAMYPEFCKRFIHQMEFDHVFCANASYCKTFSQPTTYLPYAADPALHFREINPNPSFAFGLVGSDRPERRELIDKINKNIGNAQAGFFTGVFKEDYIDALAGCNVIVNDQAGGGAGLLPMRTFEAPAAGSFLVEPIQNKELLEPIFGSNLLYYSDTDSLIAACQRTLNEPTTLLYCRKRIQAFVREHHTYDHRAKEILRTIGYA